MRNNDDRQDNHPRHGSAMRCALCDGKFGLIRYYCCRTPLCSTKCVEHFRSRRESDGQWIWQVRAV
jgi:hypothetical protein